MSKRAKSCDADSLRASYISSEKAYREAETSHLSSLSRKGSEHALNFSLLSKGTVRDRLAATETLVAVAPGLSLALVKPLLAASQRPKESLERLRGFVALLAGPLKNWLPELRPFKGAAGAEAYFASQLFELFNMFASGLEKLAGGEPEFVAREAITLAVETVPRLPDELARRIVELLIRRLPSLNEKQAQSVARCLDVALSHRAGLALPGAAELCGRLAAAGGDAGALRLLEVLAALKFSAVEDKRVLDLVVRAFLSVIGKTLDGFAGPKAFNKAAEAALQAQARPATQALAGLNKALPFLGSQAALFEFIDTRLKGLFEFVRRAPSRLAVQLLVFFFQLLKTDLEAPRCRRFMALLMDYLNKPELYSSALLPVFFDLLFSVLKADPDLSRAKKILRRLLRGAMHAEPRVAAATLILLAKVVTERPGLAPSLPRKAEPELLAKREQPTPLATPPEPDCFDEILYLTQSHHPTIRKISKLLCTGKAAEVNFKGNPFEELTALRAIKRFSLLPEKKSTTEKKGNVEPFVTYKNFEQLQKDSDSALKTYFAQKIKSLALLEKKKQKEKKKHTEEAGDEDEEADAFADELIEAEMLKLNPDEDDEVLGSEVSLDDADYLADMDDD